ncbi:MAG: hypothetical protein ACYC2H_02080 [Thermoplasmatota archaeon]
MMRTAPVLAFLVMAAGCADPDHSQLAEPAVFDVPPAACVARADAAWVVYTPEDIEALANDDGPVAKDAGWMFERLSEQVRPWAGTPYDEAEVHLFEHEGTWYLQFIGTKRVSRGEDGGTDAWQFLADSVNRTLRPQFDRHDLYILPTRIVEDATAAADRWQTENNRYPSESLFSVMWDDAAVRCIKVEYFCRQGLDTYCDMRDPQQVWVDLDGHVQGTALLQTPNG